jgi:hypothetical protein
MGCMDVLVHIAMQVLVTMFLIGAAGSMVVVVISFIEDVDLLVEDDTAIVDAPGARA